MFKKLISLTLLATCSFIVSAMEKPTNFINQIEEQYKTVRSHINFCCSEDFHGSSNRLLFQINPDGSLHMYETSAWLQTQGKKLGSFIMPKTSEEIESLMLQLKKIQNQTPSNNDCCIVFEVEKIDNKFVISAKEFLKEDMTGDYYIKGEWSEK